MSYKAIEISAELADELRKRLPFLSSTVTLQEGADANGNPTITIGDSTAASTEKNVFIRVKPIDWSLSTNIIGQTSEVFGPHIVQVATEARATNASYLAATDLLTLLGSVLRRGCRTEWWQETNGTVPTVTTFNTAAKMVAAFDPEFYHTMRASQ
jgi:hypothetical protein